MLDDSLSQKDLSDARTPAQNIPSSASCVYTSATRRARRRSACHTQARTLSFLFQKRVRTKHVQNAQSARALHLRTHQKALQKTQSQTKIDRLAKKSASDLLETKAEEAISEEDEEAAQSISLLKSVYTLARVRKTKAGSLKTPAQSTAARLHVRAQKLNRKSYRKAFRHKRSQSSFYRVASQSTFKTPFVGGGKSAVFPLFAASSVPLALLFVTVMSLMLTCALFVPAGSEDAQPDSYNLEALAKDETLSPAQKTLIEAAFKTPSQGQGRCAAFVSDTFNAAHLVHGRFGNACDMYANWCNQTDFSKLKPGMIIAVGKSANNALSYAFGHVGIYIGQGLIRENATGDIQTTKLSSWVRINAGMSQIRFGWLADYDLSLTRT